MKNVIAFEEFAMMALAVAGLYYQLLPFSWWAWILLFLLPDVGILGYLISPVVGAVTYNLFHHKAVAVLVGGIGYLTSNEYLILAGLILFGHSSFDRVLGYGLKLPDSFKHTHLGNL